MAWLPAINQYLYLNETLLDNVTESVRIVLCFKCVFVNRLQI